MIQAFLLISGVFSLWAVHSKSAKLREYGAWVGLISQPVWLMEALRTDQWAMMALSVVYGICWARGIRWKRLIARMR